MNLKAITVAVLMLAAGLGYLAMAMALPNREGIDAASVPKALAWMMIALGALELVRSIRAVSPSDIAQPAPKGGMITVGVTLVLIAAYIAALRPFGFPIATAVFLFLQFIVLTPSDRRPPYGLYALLAVVSGALIFAIFRYGFDLLLPAGPLTVWLN